MGEKSSMEIEIMGLTDKDFNKYDIIHMIKIKFYMNLNGRQVEEIKKIQ